MRGRKPKPTYLKLVKGERRPSRLNLNEPSAPRSDAEPPPGLSPTALEKWNELAPQLIEAGILTQLDRDALHAYCLAYSSLVEAQRALDRSGVVVKGYRDAPVLNPYLRARNYSLEMMRRFGEQLGLSPSSRGRIDTSGRGARSDWVADFLKGKR